MKKLSLLLLLSVFALCGCSTDNDETKKDDDKENNGGTGGDDDAQEYVLSLTDYETHKLDLGNTKNPVDSWLIYTTNYFQTLLTDKTKRFEFDCVSSDAYGFGSDSFAFTNCAVDGCTDFANYDYRALPKKGVNNNTYVIVGAAGYKVGANSDKEVAIRFKDGESTNEKEDYNVKGLYITNCIYAYNSMKEGSPFFGGLDKFENKDTFKLTIYNLNKTKKVEVYLAQGTDILKEWKWVDLSTLGETEGLKFELTTTKTNEFGAMTPSYFCIDGITIIED